MTPNAKLFAPRWKGKGSVKQDKINSRNPYVNWKASQLIYCINKSINQYKGYADLSNKVTESRKNS